MICLLLGITALLGGSPLRAQGYNAPCERTPTVRDIDRNIYNTIQIGSQCWMQSNLKVTRYRNGNPIATGLDNKDWNTTQAGAYSFFNNLPQHDATYGKLYNGFAVSDGRRICPQGWHIPSDAEWSTLVDHLKGASGAGGRMKTTTGWKSPNAGADNSSGFSALPGGFRSPEGYCISLGIDAYFWSSTAIGFSDAWVRGLNFNKEAVSRIDFPRKSGFSVRCLRD